MFTMLRNQRGMALISTYFASMAMIIIASAAWGRSFFEMQAVNREVARVRSFAAAEAGIQNALAQISLNAYTGFINTSTISVPTFQNVSGDTVGSYTVTFSYPNQADWVIATSTATVDNETKTLEGRIFLDSNLSKYLVYANTTTFSSGAGAVYGSSNGTDPQGVSASGDDRAALYVTGTWSTSGNVQMYGDVNAVGGISADSSLNVHGDVYTGGFAQNANGSVSSSGVSGSPTIGDGFSDDTDRNGTGGVTSADYPDYHSLNSTGGGDSHQTETLSSIDTSFYQTNNNIPSFAGTTAANRYLRFSTSGSNTTVTEYNSTYTSVLSTTSLPSSAIVYVNGSAYVQGEIGGRVSVVASSNINFDGNVTYAGGQTTSSSTNSAAFMAKEKLFLRASSLNVSGILYAQNNSNASVAFDAEYNTSGQSDTSHKVALNLYGNRIMNGPTNLSYYPSRTYNYDPNIKYYRPPGIPIVPSLKTVRES